MRRNSSVANCCEVVTLTDCSPLVSRRLLLLFAISGIFFEGATASRLIIDEITRTRKSGLSDGEGVCCTSE
ncbi:hypothetical protein BDV59DRAFT_167326 [Aspergillus ambiguus]|uniref:uncharacterized protein n=1 Tax=Aspergillus ambiguus TaxID=176160 RepID=UPI003CCDBBB5